MTTKLPPWIAATDAAAALGVSRATLYAYVSRGLIRSQPMPGSTRARAYAREDVERLRRRAEARRDPAQAAAHALEWGTPVLESSITFIDGESLYYRGHDVLALARTRSVADVASLVWTGAFGRRFDGAAAVAPAPGGPTLALGRDASFIARAQTMLAVAATEDAGAGDLRPTSVAEAGWRMLHLLTDAATGSVRRGKPADAPAPVDERLARAWRAGPHGAEVIRAALILCADHELNVSSFTARCVASAGSTPYAVVIAGLSALEGFRHGGSGVRVESMLAGIRAEAAGHRRRDIERAIGRATAARLRRGDAVGGFGHPLYPGGDPRARALLDLLRARAAGSAELMYIEAFAAAASTLVREAPNVDIALAAVARVLDLPAGAPLMLFAIGRTIGWIGQALEQYATGQLIRPRARYVGVRPGSD
jgi:citrate synthase